MCEDMRKREREYVKSLEDATEKLKVRQIRGGGGQRGAPQPNLCSAYAAWCGTSRCLQTGPHQGWVQEVTGTRAILTAEIICSIVRLLGTLDPIIDLEGLTPASTRVLV